LVDDVASGVLELISPWTAAALIASAVAFYASARGLQIGPGVEVIALTSVAANLIAIVGGILIFRDPVGSGAVEILGRMLAFCLGDRRGRPDPGAGPSHRRRVKQPSRRHLVPIRVTAAALHWRTSRYSALTAAMRACEAARSRNASSIPAASRSDPGIKVPVKVKRHFDREVARIMNEAWCSRSRSGETGRPGTLPIQLVVGRPAVCGRLLPRSLLGLLL
jgi:hypothetical protein